MTKERMNNISLLMMLLGIIFGMTLGRGGLYPVGRFYLVMLFGLSALLRILSEDVQIIKIVLFAPFIAAMLSLAAAPIPGLGFEYLFLLAFAAILGNLLGSFLSDDKFLYAITVGSILLSFSVVAEAIGNAAMLGLPGLAMGSSGFLLGANISSVFLAASITPVWILFREEKLNHKLAVFIFAFIALGILMTQSRTGLISAACGLFIPLFDMDKAKRKKVVVGLLSAAILGSIFYIPRLIAKFDPTYITNMQRLSMMKGVANAFKESPLLGFGQWSFPIVGQKYLEWPKWELHPHSLPLRVIFENGIIGLMAWLWLLWNGLRKNLANRGDKIALGISAAILGGSLTDDPLWMPMTLFLLMIALGRGMNRIKLESMRRWIPFSAVSLGIILCGFLPLLNSKINGLPFEPLSHRIDRAISLKKIPEFLGWNEDPTSLRIAGYVALEKSDTRGAIEFFSKSLQKDPNMIFAPSLLDLAWVYTQNGNREEAEEMINRVRISAPVLAARFNGETLPVTPSWLDRHYGIEFPDAEMVEPKMIEPNYDKLDWRHYRYEGAQALVAGDKSSALKYLETAQRLCLKEYGVDPVTYRWLSELDTQNAEASITLAKKRNGAVFPYSVFAPLIFRYPISSSGENSPWWKKKMGTDPILN